MVVNEEFGRYVPFLKSNQDKTETLVADVIRKSSNGTEVACKAEYGFGQDAKNNVIRIPSFVSLFKNQKQELARLHALMK